MRVALAALSGAALVVLLTASQRLPSWQWSVGGLQGELGPGAPAPAAAQAAPAADSRASNQQQDAGSHYVFATYAEAEEFAGKGDTHVLTPGWLPASYTPDPLMVTLMRLAAETTAATGRRERVAVTQRFTSPTGGQFTVVQSTPPPLFDFLAPYSQSPEDPVTIHGVTAHYAEYPQGTILYWHEAGETRSVGIIADPAASSQIARADWIRLAEALY